MMKRFAVASVLALLAVVAQAPGVAAQGTITDAPASFVMNTGHFSNSPSANFVGVSSTLTQDHLFETGWWYRISSDTAEHFLPVPTTQNYVGNRVTLTWTNVNSAGFDASETDTVTNGGGPSGQVTMTLTITNTGVSNLGIDIFHMADIDLAGAGSDSAALVTPNTLITVSDPSGNNAGYRGACANAYLVRPFGSTDLGSTLGNAVVDNFDNTGLPFGPADFTGGFQWTTVTIPAAGSHTFRAILAVNQLGGGDFIFADGFGC